jgi:hypothetical protein
LPIEVETYYIKSISAQSTRGFSPIYTEEYDSTFGNIILEKTPEQIFTTVMDDSKKKFATKQVVKPIASYCKFNYEFNNILSGTITINPNEIAIISAA